MAMSYAGNAPNSPSAAGGPSNNATATGRGNHSNTPPLPAAANTQQNPQSKRDKRRNALLEKYQDLTEAFTNSRDVQFRQAVQELQNEMALIANADLYDDSGPLSDSPEEVSRQLQKLAVNNQASSDVVPTGRWYSSFVQEVNKTKEERDAGLADLKNRHRGDLVRIREERDFRRQLAIEEHKKLSETIRERLVQAISSRKNRLMKDKEHLDIADTSALLLHPNQFSITNPASPGGLQGSRKTRHTRRGAEFEDLGGAIGSEAANKRKRKVPMDEENASPPRESGAGSGGGGGGGGGGAGGSGGLATPADRTKSRLNQQQNSGAYSIHSLFNERELAMHSNAAHVAAVHFLAAAKRAKTNASAPGTNGQNTDGDDTSGDGDGSAQEDGGTGATEMERTTSQNFHATRSTRTNGAANGLHLLGELADKTTTRPNLPYYILGNYHSRPNGTTTAPSPSPLMNEDIEEDLALFERAQQKPPGWVDERILKNAVQSIQDDYADEPVPNRQKFSTLHPDFPPQMDVHMVRANPPRP